MTQGQAILFLIFLAGLLSVGAAGSAGMDERSQRATAACRAFVEAHATADQNFEELHRHPDPLGLLQKRLLPALKMAGDPESELAAIYLVEAMDAAVVVEKQLDDIERKRWSIERADARRLQHSEALDSFLERNSEHRLAWHLAALHCSDKTEAPLCDRAIGDALTDLDPDNGRSWQARFMRAEASADRDQAFEQLAQLPMQALEMELGWLIYREALEALDDPSDVDRIAILLHALSTQLSMVLPQYQPLVDNCRPEALVSEGETRQSICLSVGENLAEQGATLLDRIVGYSLQEHALEAMGKSEASTAIAIEKQAQRDHLASNFLHDCQAADMLRPARVIERWSAWLRDVAEVGEIEAAVRMRERTLDRWAPEGASATY